MPIPPLVLNVFLCDTVHRDRDSGKHYILGTFNTLSFPEFPATLPMTYLFLTLIEVNGIYDLRVQIVDVNDDDEPIHQFSGRLEGSNPLAIFEFPLPLVDVQFPEAGDYRVQVFIDEEVIAERRLKIQEKEGGR